MFTSQKVENYLQSCKFAGDEEKPALNCAFYVTPLTHDLCYELDHHIARQLFRKEGSAQNPVLELDDVTLKVPNIGGAFNVEFYPHNADGADGAGVLVQACVIGKVEASKLFADKPDWSLIWHVTMPLDDHSLKLMRKYYKRSVFITLEKMQDDLFNEKDAPKPKQKQKGEIIDEATVECRQPVTCEICDETATYLGENQAGYCDKDLKGAIDIRVRKIRYVEGVQSH